MMNKMVMVTILVLILFLTLMNAEAKKKGKKESMRAVATDLPLIACDVCRQVMTELYTITDNFRQELTGKQKLEEIKISDAMDNVCEEAEDAGAWIRHMDITKSGSAVVMKGMDGVSKCEEECLTIKRSCNDLLEEDIDRDEVSALLYKGKMKDEDFVKRVCQDMSERCPTKNTKANQNASKNRVDYPFNEISEKDLEMEKLMAQMKSSGLGGGMNMYSREDLEDMDPEDMMGGYGGGYDNYGDSDGEDTEF